MKMDAVAVVALPHPSINHFYAWLCLCRYYGTKFRFSIVDAVWIVQRICWNICLHIVREHEGDHDWTNGGYGNHHANLSKR